MGYHFPGGWSQLQAEALRWAAQHVTGAISSARARGASAAQVFAMLCGHYRRQLDATSWLAGGPVDATAVEAFDDVVFVPIVAEVMASWVDDLARVLVAEGRPDQEANDVATLCLSSLEGAIMLARVHRSTHQIEVVQTRVGRLLVRGDGDPAGRAT